jgi:hypothetical protein
VLARLRARNLPERIDADYLRDAGVSEGTISRALFALRFLGLVDGEAPSEALKAIAKATDEEYRVILAGLIREAYGEVFDVVDPAQDTQAHIVNFFRRYTPGSQRERMVIFFLGMCREAGIPTLDVPRQRSSGVVTGSTKLARLPASRAPSRPPPKPPVGGERRRDSGGIPPALELLVQSLPPAGTPLSAARRQQWLTMADAALAFIYPEESTGPALALEDDEEE